jgi:hypothetical protein
MKKGDEISALCGFLLRNNDNDDNSYNEMKTTKLIEDL